jgi:hypothetical protein
MFQRRGDAETASLSLEILVQAFKVNVFPVNLAYPRRQVNGRLVYACVHTEKRQIHTNSFIPVSPTRSCLKRLDTRLQYLAVFCIYHDMYVCISLSLTIVP